MRSIIAPRRLLLLVAIAGLASSCVNGVDEGGAMGMFLTGKHGDEEAVHAVCGSGATTAGIDVSSWQGSINWATVAKAWSSVIEQSFAEGPRP